MVNAKKITAISVLFLFLTSCTCGTPLRVTPIQKTDKKLTCEQIIIEINEAEHYRSEAASEQAVGLGEALMPICWVTGFVDGEVGIKKANARINYLGSTYDLLDCGGKGKPKKDANANAAPQQTQPPIIVPVLQPRQPALQPREPLQSAPLKAREVIEPKELEPIKTLKKQGHYKIMNNLGPDEMHEHKDKDGKLYIHSHKHSGAHRHLEDQ